MTEQRIAVATLLWTQIAAIGQVAGALATTAAVIVSLYIAISDRKYALGVSVGIRLLFAGEGSSEEKLVAYSVMNTGQHPFRINSIGWRTGWVSGLFRRIAPRFIHTRHAIQIAGDHPSSTQLPCDVHPGNSVSFVIDYKRFERDRTDGDNDFFNRTEPFFKSEIRPLTHGVIHIVGAKPKHYRVEKSLHCLLTDGRINLRAT
jgi:hypothetical protein